MRFSTSITVSGNPVITNVPRGTKAWRLANSIFCPLGAAPTQAWMLMLKSELESLAVNDPHTITWKEIFDDGSPTRTLEFKGLYIVNAERVLQGGPSDGNALFLVEFADGRHLAGLNSATGPVRANLRSYANAADYLTGTSGVTWDNLLSNLWSTCGTLGSYPNLPGGLPIDGRPENTWLIGLNSLRSLHAVLDQLDCAIQPDPFAGIFSIAQLGAAQDLNLTSEFLKWNAEPPTVNSNKAATLRVHFFYHRKAYGQERDTELASNWAVVGASDVIDRATGISGAVGMKFLWDDLPMVFDETNTHINSSDTNQRADNRKARYVTRYSVANAHRIYAGLVAIIPGGQVKAILWRNYDDGEESDIGGTVTEFISRPELVTGLKPGNGGPAWFDGELAAPEREQYSGPDYSRHSFPNYPRLPNIVQVWNVDGTPGDSMDANGDGFHRGRVKRWVSNSMATLDDCWIRFVDGHDDDDGQVKAVHGEYYGPARLSGIATVVGEDDSETLPVYLVRKGVSEKDIVTVVYFTVVNYNDGLIDAHYESHFPEASDPPELDESGNFIVHDDNGLFPLAIPPGLGMAFWNSDRELWEVFFCQQQCIKARALADPPGSSGFSGPGFVTITNFVAVSPSPFNLVPNPLPTQALNIFQHRGMDNDDLLLYWDHTAEVWAIEDVQKHDVITVIDVRLSGNNIQVKPQTIATEISAVSTTWVTVIDGNPCTNP